MQVQCWQMEAVGKPLSRGSRSLDVDQLPRGQVVVEVAGCGVCHTDLGFLFDGVPTRHALPLTLGHEISGVVRHAGAGAAGRCGDLAGVPGQTPWFAGMLSAGSRWLLLGPFRRQGRRPLSR